jgi:hypothetical protein
VALPLELVPLHSGALPMPAVSVRSVQDGRPGADPLPLALASAATVVLVEPLDHALFTAPAAM